MSNNKQTVLNVVELMRADFNKLEQNLFATFVALDLLEEVVLKANSGQEVFDALKPFLDNIVLLQSSMDSLDDNATMAAQALDPVMKRLDGKLKKGK